MPERVTNNRKKEFIEALEKAGGSSGNGRLRKSLDWSEDFYWKVQGSLIEANRIVAGRGYGGSVRLTEAEIAQIEPQETAVPEANIAAQSEAITKRERDLYAPFKAAIETRWINRFGFDDSAVDETHSRGSKDTGGTFTRPDITAVGIRRYVFLPQSLEIITFEVKSADYVNVLGVLEAIAHREAAHRSYAVYAISKQRFDEQPQSDRIVELAQKYGVGVILADNVESVEGWELPIDAIRHEPDPARLDRFLGDLPSEAMRNELSKWKRG